MHETVSPKDIDEVFSCYKEIQDTSPGLLPLGKPSKKKANERRTAVGKLLLDMPYADIESAFRKAAITPYLCGHGKDKWRAGFDWLIDADNLRNVAAGVYDAYDARDGTGSPEKIQKGQKVHRIHLS